MVFFTFPEDVRWNAQREAAEFSVILGSYEGGCRGAHSKLLEQAATPQRCLAGCGKMPPASENRHSGRSEAESRNP
jgi:hypothetical protein